MKTKTIICSLALLLCACAPKHSSLASQVTFDIGYQGGVVKTYWRKLGDKPAKEFVLGVIMGFSYYGETPTNKHGSPHAP
ncbi:hypothetical protein HBZS_111290 [Helicobacter bizzozeronii CCUG 35545]|nr:hypothetical protein HBZS_111290 [Helicobacter bizzozeronii CCUG 35545]